VNAIIHMPGAGFQFQGGSRVCSVAGDDEGLAGLPDQPAETRTVETAQSRHFLRPVYSSSTRSQPVRAALHRAGSARRREMVIQSPAPGVPLTKSVIGHQITRSRLASQRAGVSWYAA